MKYEDISFNNIKMRKRIDKIQKDIMKVLNMSEDYGIYTEEEQHLIDTMTDFIEKYEEI